MPNRTPLFLDTTTGSLKGISSTADNAFVAGVQSGAATNLTLQRTTTGAATVTLNAASVALGADMTALTVAPTAGTFSLANTGATTLNLGGAATAINMGATGGLTTITGSARVTGNLTVVGTTTTTESETVLIADNHLYLNNGYATTVAQTGGLVVNRLPIATSTTVAGAYVAGVPATSNPTVTTAGTGTFSAGQLIQIGGSVNPGLYEVLSHIGTTLTIKGVGTTPTVEDFTQNDFTAAASDGATITRLNVSVIRANAAGTFWEVGYGATTPISFSSLSTSAGATLQAAYDASSAPATIATNATDQEVLISGTAGLRVTGTGADATTGFGFDVNTTGGWQILGDAASEIQTAASNLTIRTVTSGTLAVNSAGALDMDAGAAGATLDTTGGFSIDGATASNVTVTGAAADLTLSSVGGSVVVQGTEAAADAVRLNASNAAGGIDADAGTGGVTIDTTAGISLDAATASNFTVTGAADLTLSSTGGSVIATSGEAAADAIRIFASNAAGGIDADAGTAGVAVDSTGPISLDSTGTASNLTLAASAAGTATLVIAVSNAGAGTGVLDVDADDAINIDSAAAGFSVDGVTSSNVTVTGAAQDLTLSSVGGSVIVQGTEAAADAVRIFASNAAGGIDADAGTAGATLDSTGTISLDAAAASNFSTSSGDLTLAATANSVVVTGAEAAVDAITLTATNAAGGIDVNAGTGGITVDTTAGFSIDGDTASNVTVTTGNLTVETVTSGNLILRTTTAGDVLISTTTAGEIDLTSAGLMDMNAGANLDIDVTGTYDMLSTGAFSIDGTGASNVTADAGNLTLSTTTSGSISIDSVAGVTLDAQGATSFVTAVTGTDTSATSFRVQNNSLTTKFSVTGNGVITLGSAATDDVVFTADVESNVLPGITATYNLGSATRRWGVFASSLDSTAIGTTYVSGAAITANRVVYKDGTADRVQHATNTGIATANTVVGVARTGAGAAGSDITVDYAGVVTMNATGAITVGQILYLDTAGNVTATPPSVSGEVILVVGFAKTANGGSGTFLAHLAPRTPFEIP